MIKKLKIISIFDSIPAQLNEQNRRFIFTQLNKELKFERYENSFFVVERCRCSNICI